MVAPVIQFKRGLLTNLPGLRAGEPGFTTDSYDFYIGISSELSTNKFFGSHRYWTKESSSTGSGLNLVEGTSNGSGYITLKSPDSLSGVGTYTLPDTSTISDGYFLKVSSDGTLSWDTSSGTGGSFTNSTLTGVTTVTGSLNVSGNSDFSGITTFTNTTDNILGDADTGAVQIDGGFGVNNNVTVGGNINVQGYSEFVGVSTFTGAIDANGGADISGQVILNDTLSVTGVSTFTGAIDANGGADISGGETTLSSATVSDLTNNRVVIAGTSGALEDDANFTYDGTDLSVNSAKITDLTSGRVLLAGTSGAVEDSGNLTFNGTTLTVTGAAAVDNVSISGIVTAASVVFGSGTAITSVDTDLSAVSASDDTLASAKAIKSYVDSQVTAQDLDIQADSGGALSIDLDSETLTIAGTAGEIETSGSGNTITIGLPDTVIVGTAVSTPTLQVATIKHNNGTAAATIDTSGNLTASQNLTVSGNLFVNGSTTQVNTSSMTVEDRTIELGQVDGSAPSSATTWDLGVLFNYNASGAKKSAVIWEHADSRFKFGSQVTDGGGTDNDSPQITVSNYAPIEIGSLWVNDCAGQSQVISCTGSERFLENITIDAGTF